MPRKSLIQIEQLFEGDLGQSDDVLTLSAEEDLLKSPVSGQDKKSKAPSRDNQHKRQENKKRHVKSKAGFQEKIQASFSAKKKHLTDQTKQPDDTPLKVLLIKIDSIPQSEAWDEEEKNRRDKTNRAMKRLT